MRKKGLFCLLAFLLLFAAGTFSVRAAGTYTESGGVDVSDYSNAVKCHTMSNGCRTDFADIQNKKECGGNRQWQNHYLRNWAANTKGKGII